MKILLINFAKKLLPFLFKPVKKSLKDVSGVSLHEDPSTSSKPVNQKSALIFIHGFGGTQDGTWGDTFKYLRENPKFADFDIYSYGYNSGLLPDIKKDIWIGQASLKELGLGVRREIEMYVDKGYNLSLIHI